MARTRENLVDVLVLGGGPAGSSTANACAARGLTTLLLERKQWPRDKVCSGMVMGRWATEVLEREFGPIPDDVLADPSVLAGHTMHVAGTEPVSFGMRTPIGWRRDLDAWMVRSAVERGVEFRDRSRVVAFAREAGRYRLTVRQGREEQWTVSARFVVGAEGAASPTRKALFPDLSVRYGKPLREVYKGELNLRRDQYHWFFPKGKSRPRFGVNHKGSVFMIEGRDLEALRPEIERILVPLGFRPSEKPAIRDGCMIAVLHEQLLDGSFCPAAENCLLVGDAAGVILPITFEGISTAVWSGRLAAEAIGRVVDGREPTAAESYLTSLLPVLELIARFKREEETLAKSADDGAEAVAQALVRAYQLADS